MTMEGVGFRVRRLGVIGLIGFIGFRVIRVWD